MSTYPHPLFGHKIPAGRLWFGMLGATLAWIFELMLGVLISWQGCRRGGVSLNSVPVFSLQWVIAGITIVLFAVAVAAGVVSYQNLHQLTETRVAEAEAPGREEYMSLAGIFISVVFAIAIMWSGLPLFLTDVCERIR